MIGWRSDVVTRLGISNRVAELTIIRADAVLVCKFEGDRKDYYFDLETGLLHRNDPRRKAGSLGCSVDIVGMAPTILEQFVVAIANPQVRADHLCQGLKASSILVPKELKFIRNYLGGVLIIYKSKQISVSTMIDFIMRGLHKE